MALFVLMDSNVATKILRIELDSNASSTINTIFNNQKLHFESHHSTVLSFYAGYTPSYGECFKLSNFKESAALIDAVTRSTAIPVWDPNKIDAKHIKALFVGIASPQNNDLIAIQTFNKKQILDTSKSFVMKLFSSSNTFSKADNVGFNLDDKLVAIINGSDIFFKSFFKLRSIFDMSNYFEEATDQEVNDFAMHSAFEVPPGFKMDTVADTVIRTKVTLINKSGTLNTQTISTLKSAAQKINFPLQVSLVGGIEKIIIPQEKKAIKALLDFLDEDIFTSEITQTVYKSNSKRKYN
ncbi:Kiwa anti-phage protein KwaB-like domain-containing protein [Lonsdalea quercina]|uniref:Kiwa anti-phage protein KwaB-like domain-containing protein n=1 Tax=Lonsdalea quercina TaxID=71657 RepID=UPI0039760BA6